MVQPSMETGNKTLAFKINNTGWSDVT